MEKLNTCPPNKIFNPNTNRCVLKSGAIGKKILASLIIKKSDIIKDCPPDKIFNPNSNRCVLKSGAIGKKLLASLIIDNSKNKFIDKPKNKPIDKPALSDLLENTFKYYPLDHSFDEDAVKKFLKECDPSVKSIAEKIIINTDHISFEQLLTRINKIIKELFIKIKNSNVLFIYIGNKIINIKNKSNYWLYLYISNYIKFKSNNSIKIILTANLNKIQQDNANIILIDDCIYTGLQMSTTINNISYNIKNKLNFYIVVPYISQKGMDKIKQQFKNSHINNCTLNFFENTYIIKSINSVLTPQEINKIQMFYLFFISFNNKYLIYFDHKIADIVSTIIAFYMGIVPCNDNYDIYKYYNGKITIPKDKLSKYKIIPLFKNCSHYTNNIDLLSSKCPWPPYKKGFTDFIKNYKKKKKRIILIIIIIIFIFIKLFIVNE